MSGDSAAGKPEEEMQPRLPMGSCSRPPCVGQSGKQVVCQTARPRKTADHSAGSSEFRREECGRKYK